MDKDNEKHTKLEFFSKNKKPLIITGIIIGVLLTSIVTYGVVVYNNAKSWQDKVYPGVSVYGVELGGLTKEQVISKLGEALPTLIMDKKIDVLVGDKKMEMKYSDISPVYDYKDIAEKAINYKKDATVLEKNNIIKNGADYKIEATIDFNKEKLTAFEEEVKKQVDVEPKNAQISINGSNISITPSILGHKIDGEDLHKRLLENINGNPQEVVELKFDLVEVPAKIKESDLKKITGKISSYSNEYTGGDNTGRFINMKLAVEAVNGTLLMPGQEFSYNNVVGNTTPERGYKEANTYVGNKIVPGYGGGICQVSTALYRSIMRSNIRSTERMNHSMTVSYSKPGLDATVSYGYIDYKFVNTYDFPIYIQGFIGGGTLGFNIYGNTSALDGKTYDLVSEINETYEPKVEYVDDANLEAGKEVTESTGMTGYKSTTYLVTYQNGTEIKRERIGTDVYKTTNTIIKRGTKKAAAEPEKAPEKPEKAPAEHEKPPTEHEKPQTEHEKPQTEAQR